MIRRSRLVLITGVALVGTTVAIVATIAAVFLKSEMGREWVQQRIEREVRTALGESRFASFSGLRFVPLGTVSIDSIVVRDSSGAAVVATGGVELRYSIGPLLDNELHLTLVRLTSPRVDAVRDSAGQWNLAGLFASTGADTLARDRGGRPWRVRIDSLALTDGHITVTTPDSLPALPPVRRTLSRVSAHLGDTRIDPAAAAVTSTLRQLAFTSSEPPVELRSASGTVELDDQTVRVDLASWALPHSRGSLRGSIGLPRGEEDPRLALTLRAERFDFAELGWMSALVPAAGGGRATVAIRNGPRDGIVRFAVSDLQAEATGSQFSGRLVADLADEFALRDLDLTASPLDLRLVRELFGDSTPPQPLDGVIRGRIFAAGGTLDQWLLDSAVLEYEDRRLEGARSRFTVSGTLDLLAPQTVLSPLDVRIDSLDVRTLGAVVDVADSLRGFVTGRVRLEGPVDDLAFRDLQIAHRDGALPVSRINGEGRFADDRSRTWLEARLDLERITVAAFGHAYTDEPLAGIVAGTLTASARGDSVALDLALEGEGAELAFVGATSLDTARLVVRGDLRITGLDARRFLPESGLPGHYLTARATLGFDSPWETPEGPVELEIAEGSEIGGFVISSGNASLVLEPGGVRVDTLAMEGPVGRLRARGRLSRDPTLRDTLRFAMLVDSVAGLRGFLSDSLAAAWIDSLGGRIRLEGIALGSFDTLDVRAELTVDSLRAGSHSARILTADLLLDGIPHATRGLATMRAEELVIAGVPIAELAGEATVRGPAWADASLRLVAGDTLHASLRADVHWMGDSLAVQLDSLDATTRDARWRLLTPASLFIGPDRTTLTGLDLRSSEGAKFAVDAATTPNGSVDIAARIVQVPLAHARFTGLVPARIAGLVSVDAKVLGTRRSPQITFTAALDSVKVDEREAPSLLAEGTYADLSADLTIHAPFRGRDAFSVRSQLPLDLTFESRVLADRLLDGELYVRLVADGAPMTGVAALIPGARDLAGGFDADLQIGGTWRDPEPRGLLIIRDAAFYVPALGTGFRDGLLDLAFSPDSIILHRARLSDERSTNDSLSVDGAVVRTRTGWRADLRTIARRMRLIDDPRVAVADVTWSLRLAGPIDSLVLNGDVTLPTADITIGQQQRRVLVLEEDVVAEAEAMKYVPRIEQLRVRLGNEVRLRSPEASVQLTGTVDVTGTLANPDVRGEIIANRGTYRLDLGLLQRTFQVDSGRVRMNGPLSVPATLDIHTTYIVRQAERDDVRIGARLTGTVDQPRLVLSSGDLGTTASETEIISYLLFGAPTFVLDGESASAVRLATAALVPSLGGAAERALGARIPFLSELQVTTIAGDSPRDFTLNSFEGLLNSFALTAGTQIGTDSYLRVSGGVCRGENRAAQSLPAWMGMTAEYRPREKLSAELSLAPGGSPCNRVGTWTQIYQFGLDLFRDFRW